jgi:hypothetical protein
MMDVIQDICINPVYNECETNDENDYNDQSDIQYILLSMQEKINNLELENNKLKQNIQFKDDMLIKATNAIVQETGRVKRRQNSKKSIYNKAKWIFYNEHKNNPSIKHPLEEEIKTYKIKPSLWRNIKTITDSMFIALNDTEKNMYIQKAEAAFEITLGQSGHELLCKSEV